jgi:excisionase family DNA binding protein
MYLTPKQAAARACVSVSLIYALLRNGRLLALRVGVRGKGKWLIRSEDLDAFLASCKLSEWPVLDGPLKHLR